MNRAEMETERHSSCSYYPLFLSLKGRVCLVVGGGAVGERKVSGLLRSGASVRIAAVELTPRLSDLRAEGRLELLGAEYKEELLEGVDLVFAATSDFELNDRIAADAHKRRLWCNSATNPEACSFIVPSVVRQGPLSIAISTGGFSPALAKILRERLEEQFGPEWVVYLRLMGRLRTAVQAEGLESSLNRKIFRRIAALPILEWIKEGERDRVLDEIHGICGASIDRRELNRIWDEVWRPSSL